MCIDLRMTLEGATEEPWFELAHMWIWKHAGFDELTLNYTAPISSGTEWQERFAPLFLWWFPVSYFPSFRPHTFNYPHPFPASSSSSLLYSSLSRSLSLRKHVMHIKSGGVKWASLIKQPVSEVNSNISAMRKWLRLKLTLEIKAKMAQGCE